VPPARLPDQGPAPHAPETLTRMGRGVPNVAPAELRAQLEAFVRYRREHLTGDEKGEAQVYCDRDWSPPDPGRAAEP